MEQVQMKATKMVGVGDKDLGETDWRIQGCFRGPWLLWALSGHKERGLGQTFSLEVCWKDNAAASRDVALAPSWMQAEGKA